MLTNIIFAEFLATLLGWFFLAQVLLSAAAVLFYVFPRDHDSQQGD